jgi:hypothetical protein
MGFHCLVDILVCLVQNTGIGVVSDDDQEGILYTALCLAGYKENEITSNLMTELSRLSGTILRNMFFRQTSKLGLDFFRQRGVPVRVISTPRDISMGCGLSVRFPLNEARQVRAALRGFNTHNLIGLYRAEYDGARLRVAPLGALN